MEIRRNRFENKADPSVIMNQIRALLDRFNKSKVVLPQLYNMDLIDGDVIICKNCGNIIFQNQEVILKNISEERISNGGIDIFCLKCRKRLFFSNKPIEPKISPPPPPPPKKEHEEFISEYDKHGQKKFKQKTQKQKKENKKDLNKNKSKIGIIVSIGVTITIGIGILLYSSYTNSAINGSTGKSNGPVVNDITIDNDYKALEEEVSIKFKECIREYSVNALIDTSAIVSALTNSCFKRNLTYGTKTLTAGIIVDVLKSNGIDISDEAKYVDLVDCLIEKFCP